MCDDNVIRRIAGMFVMVSVVLAVWVSPWWLFFTAFVGLNLIQSSVTNWCLLERVLGRLGLFGCEPVASRR